MQMEDKEQGILLLLKPEVNQIKRRNTSIFPNTIQNKIWSVKMTLGDNLMAHTTASWQSVKWS